jgi:VRR-NUC domain.
MTKNHLNPTEAQEQETLFRWTEFYAQQQPDIELLLHIPNGGSRHPAEAANLKRQGVKAGVPDLLLPVARKGYHGLWIEMKRIGGRISPNQQYWLRNLGEQGYKCEVCYGYDEAVKVIKEYME